MLTDVEQQQNEGKDNSILVVKVIVKFEVKTFYIFKWGNNLHTSRKSAGKRERDSLTCCK